MPNWDIKVNHIRVGQGDATLIRIQEILPNGSTLKKLSRFILIDGGDGVQFQNVISTFEQNLGETPFLDAVILTHDDHDHVGGLIKFFKDDESVKKYLNNTFFYEQGVIRKEEIEEELVIQKKTSLDTLTQERHLIPIFSAPTQRSKLNASQAADKAGADQILSDRFLGEDFLWNFTGFQILTQEERNFLESCLYHYNLEETTPEQKEQILSTLRDGNYGFISVPGDGRKDFQIAEVRNNISSRNSHRLNKIADIAKIAAERVKLLIPVFAELVSDSKHEDILKVLKKLGFFNAEFVYLDDEIFDVFNILETLSLDKLQSIVADEGQKAELDKLKDELTKMYLRSHYVEFHNDFLTICNYLLTNDTPYNRKEYAENLKKLQSMYKRMHEVFCMLEQLRGLVTTLAGKPLLLCVAVNEKTVQPGNVNIAEAGVTPQNRRSIVSLLISPDNQILHYLGGDSTEVHEKAIARWLNWQKTSTYSPYMKLSHHGSRGSTPPELLMALRPKFAIVSSGDGSQHGHPSVDLLEYIRIYNKAFFRNPIRVIATVYPFQLATSSHSTFFKNSKDIENSLTSMMQKSHLSGNETIEKILNEIIAKFEEIFLYFFAEQKDKMMGNFKASINMIHLLLQEKWKDLSEITTALYSQNFEKLQVLSLLFFGIHQIPYGGSFENELQELLCKMLYFYTDAGLENSGKLSANIVEYLLTKPDEYKKVKENLPTLSLFFYQKTHILVFYFFYNLYVLYESFNFNAQIMDDSQEEIRMNFRKGALETFLDEVYDDSYSALIADWDGFICNDEDLKKNPRLLEFLDGQVRSVDINYTVQNDAGQEKTSSVFSYSLSSPVNITRKNAPLSAFNLTSGTQAPTVNDLDIFNEHSLRFYDLNSLSIQDQDFVKELSNSLQEMKLYSVKDYSNSDLIRKWFQLFDMKLTCVVSDMSPEKLVFSASIANIQFSGSLLEGGQVELIPSFSPSSYSQRDFNSIVRIAGLIDKNDSSDLFWKLMGESFSFIREKTKIIFSPKSNLKTRFLFSQKLNSISFENFSIDDIELSFNANYSFDTPESFSQTVNYFLDATLNIGKKEEISQLTKPLFRRNHLAKSTMFSPDQSNLSIPIRMGINKEGVLSVRLTVGEGFNIERLLNAILGANEERSRCFQQLGLQLELIKAVEIGFNLSDLAHPKIIRFGLTSGLNLQIANTPLVFDISFNVINPLTWPWQSAILHGRLQVSSDHVPSFQNILPENSNYFSEINNYPIADVRVTGDIAKGNYTLSASLGKQNEEGDDKTEETVTEENQYNLVIIEKYFSITSLSFKLSKEEVEHASRYAVMLNGIFNLSGSRCFVRLDYKTNLQENLQSEWKFKGGFSYLSLNQVLTHFGLEEGRLPEFFLKDVALEVAQNNKGRSFELQGAASISQLLFDFYVLFSSQEKNIKLSWRRPTTSDQLELTELISQTKLPLILPSSTAANDKESFKISLTEASFNYGFNNSSKTSLELSGRFLIGHAIAALLIDYRDNAWRFEATVKDLSLGDILGYDNTYSQFPIINLVDTHLEIAQARDQEPAYFKLVSHIKLAEEKEISFELNLSSGKKTFEAQTKSIRLSDLLKVFGLSPNWLHGLDFELQSIAISYVESNLYFSLKVGNRAAPTHINFLFRKNKQNTRDFYACISQSFANGKEITLPIIGDFSNPITKLQIVYLAQNEAPLSETDLSLLNLSYFSNQQLEKHKKLSSGFNVVVEGNFSKDQPKEIFVLPIKGSTEAPPQLPALLSSQPFLAASNDSEKSESSTPTIKWLLQDISLSSLKIPRLGIIYEEGYFGIIMDIDFNLGALMLALKGFGVKFNLSSFFGGKISDAQDIQVILGGLGLGYHTPALSIQGNFESLKEDAYEYIYAGQVMLQAKGLAMQASGSYGKMQRGKPSLFIFARVSSEKGFGGPPEFFITGFSGGFGYNQQLKPLTIEKVATFPLLPAESEAAAAAQTLSNAAEAIIHYLEPKEDQTWLAAGLNFTTYEIANSSALAVASFGDKFKFELFGFSKIVLPPLGKKSQSRTPVFASVELALMASFIPEDGILSLQAQLTNNSYIFSKNCHLTGGAAFFTWFGRHPNSGDFVVSVGGYHPHFIKPAHYPSVPRLGFNWKISSELSLQGEAYFALTPSCIMAGGLLKALYESGNLRAWFNAYADLLINWAPFSYDLALGISLGISYQIKVWFIKKTIEAHINATLNLWGPPMGGRVSVDISVVSVTIRFGSDKNNNRTISWNDFKVLLPSTEKDKVRVCEITCENGLIYEDEQGRWIVNADFTFSTKSIIPLSKVYFNHDVILQNNPEINIKPLGEKNVLSEQRIYFVEKEKSSPVEKLINSELKSNLPAALWSKPSASESSDAAKTMPDRLISNCLTGARISSYRGLVPNSQPVNKKLVYTLFKGEEIKTGTLLKTENQQANINISKVITRLQGSGLFKGRPGTNLSNASQSTAELTGRL